MRDRNIILIFMLCAALALVACGELNNKNNSDTAEETAEIPNPWTETADLEEAEKATGIDFDAPVEGALPDGFTLETYRYTDSILEADYVKGEEKLSVRVSTTLSGLELSGDYTEYSKEWDESLKGLTVHCQGDGTAANCATADLDDIHFAVSCSAGEEGKGLIASQLMDLFMGMQAVPLQ